MKINQNMMAVITNKQLLRTENNLSTSMERLSSGLKINHAKDNPAGIAISNKMQAQIDALDRASQNASDGSSVIQIADGALNEVSSILQRMRELSVQAANDTNNDEDKQAMQDEINSLKKEVDRISTDTEYNQKSLLNGTLDTRVYANNASRMNISDYVEAGNYSLEITAATQDISAGSDGTKDYMDSTDLVGASGTISINGSKVQIQATDTYAAAYEKIRNAAELGEATADFGTSTTTDPVTGEESTVVDTTALSFTSTAYGSSATLDITFSSNDDLAGFMSAIGFATTDCAEITDTTGAVVGYQLNNTQNGTDAAVTLDKATSDFGSTATVASKGNRVTVTDSNGFSMSFLAEAGYSGEIDIEVTEIGTMTLQIGANESQNMDVRIPEVSTESLYIDDLDVRTVTGASRAITSLDEAISQVSAVRSSLGANQNRLEYAIGSLDESEENMTSALSRIQDVDMADEMTSYTQYNVLDQAAISVLSQANDIPQQVLQLLQ